MLSYFYYSKQEYPLLIIDSGPTTGDHAYDTVGPAIQMEKSSLEIPQIENVAYSQMQVKPASALEEENNSDDGVYEMLYD